MWYVALKLKTKITCNNIGCDLDNGDSDDDDDDDSDNKYWY